MTIFLKEKDKEVFEHIAQEMSRQKNSIELIASENIVSESVLEAAGSVLTNKYAEGYPSHRYYGGCENVDEIESIAIKRAQKLFDCSYANVQPHSGSNANLAVFFSFLKPGDTYLAMSLAHGGHLTHGAKPNFSGKWFNPIHYTVREDNGYIDYDLMRDLAKKHNPKIIIAGGSAYSRQIDFKIFREVADEVGAMLWVDMAHFAGIVAAKKHPNPLLYADVVTTTTHKTLRGPRGGLILSDKVDVGKIIDKSIFPGIQGGPLMHIIAAKAVAFAEADSKEFKTYIQNVLDNAKVMTKKFQQNGYDIVSGGTDTHLFLLDLRNKKLKGNIAQTALEEAGIVCNKNSIPFDTEKPTVTSGLRFGTPASTSRGFRENEFKEITELICEILNALNEQNNKISSVKKSVYDRVIELCRKNPIYQNQEI